MSIVGIPSNYEYGHLKEEVNNWTSLRSNSILNKDDFLKWLEEYSSNTLTTWRILKTFPDSGKVNVYKSAWRCHHYVYKHKDAPSSNRASKNTNCPAKIVVIIKRFIEKSRSKDPEYTLNKEWPCKIEINANHNHPLKPFFCSTINSKALLKPTTTDTTTVINISVNTVVDPATITAATGTTTTSAANGITATGTIVAAVDNKTTVGAITAVDTSTTDTSLQDIPDNWFQDLQDDQNEGYCDSTSVSSLQSQSQMNNPESEDVKINLVVQSNLLNDLDKLVSWIKHGVSEKPKDFLPALHAMMNSVKRNIKTDVCLIDAMRNFGKYSRDEKIKGSGRDRKIGIKAVSISKRKNSRLTSKTVMLRSNIRHDRND